MSETLPRKCMDCGKNFEGYPDDRRCWPCTHATIRRFEELPEGEQRAVLARSLKIAHDVGGASQLAETRTAEEEARLGALIAEEAAEKAYRLERAGNMFLTDEERRWLEDRRKELA